MRPAHQSVTLVMAVTVDGKIARADRVAPHFGPADALRFEQLCAAADALVLGAGTLRAQGGTRTILRPELLAQRAGRGQPPQPLTVVVSHSGQVDPNLGFFTRQRVPRAVATLDAVATAQAGSYGALAEVWGCGGAQVEPEQVLARLAERGHRRIALLGGGELNAAWFAHDCVDELELTLAPLLFGGSAAPTPLDGPGLPSPRRLLLCHSHTIDGCLFLRYRVLPES